MSTLVFPLLLLGDGRVESIADADDFRVLLELSSGVDLRGGFYERARFVDAESRVHYVRKLVLTAGGFLTWMKRRRIEKLEMDGDPEPLALDELRRWVLVEIEREPGLWSSTWDLGTVVSDVSAASSLSELRAVFAS